MSEFLVRFIPLLFDYKSESFPYNRLRREVSHLSLLSAEVKNPSKYSFGLKYIFSGI
jgi:hypothetical protein